MPENKDKNTLFYREKQAYKFNFGAKAISSDGAILLSEKIERKTKILRSFANLIPDHRDSSRIEYSYFDMLKQRVFLLMQGYEDCNDEEKLRNDPVLTQVLGKELCSQPTLSRFENQADKKLIYILAEWFVDYYVSGLEADRAEIVIDVDGTDAPTHGGQQLTLFNGYYGHYMYDQLFFKDGKTGQIILPVLRPGNSHSSRWFTNLLERVVNKIKQVFPQMRVVIRADSGFSGAGFYKLVAEQELKYALGISANSVLKTWTEEAVKRIKADYADHGIKHQELLGPVLYQAGSWEQEEKVYAKVESTGKGMNVRYFISNLEDLSSKQIYFDFYVKRGEHSENRIKEVKNMCFSDRLSCQTYCANYFRLMLSCLGYEMFRQIKLMIAKTSHQKAKKWQIDSIRLYLLKVGATLKKRVRSITIEFSKAFPQQELLGELLRC